MLTLTIMALYRILAITIILIPMVQNIINQGEIVDSLLYMPLLTLALTLFFVVVDKKLGQTLSVYTHTSSDRMGIHSVKTQKVINRLAHNRKANHQKLPCMRHKLCNTSFIKFVILLCVGKINRSKWAII